MSIPKGSRRDPLIFRAPMSVYEEAEFLGVSEVHRYRVDQSLRIVDLVIPNENQTQGTRSRVASLLAPVIHAEVVES